MAKPNWMIGGLYNQHSDNMFYCICIYEHQHCRGIFFFSGSSLFSFVPRYRGSRFLCSIVMHIPNCMMLIVGFHRALLQSVTFIGQLNALGYIKT